MLKDQSYNPDPTKFLVEAIVSLLFRTIYCILFVALMKENFLEKTLMSQM